MKTIAWGIVFCTVSFMTSPGYGGQEASGLYGIEVSVKEKPSKHAATDVNGNFTLTALPPGSYTLSLRAQRAKDLPHSTSNKVMIATLYSIKIEGTKHSINRSGLTSDQLLAGVDLQVEVRLGVNVRGEVRPGATKKMVWVPGRTGSNISGHWAVEGSEAASASNLYEIKPGTWIYR